MTLTLPFNKTARKAAAIGTVLLVAACANPNKPKVAGAGLSGGATPGSVQDFTVNVGDRILFETDSSSLTGEARQILQRQAQWLKRYPNHRVRLEGHADERGTREYNLALGARRAAATKNYLISLGLSPNRLMTLSLGKERPVAVCNDISCWSQNRRAVTILGN